MREIKFRGRRLDNGEWVYGLLCRNINVMGAALCIQIVCEKVVDGFESPHLCREIDLETVGQFTGLKDKNGRDIYEGDIIRLESGRICQVKHGRVTEYCVNKRDGVTDMFQYFGFGLYLKEMMFHFDSPETVEVIGNIHNNPELISATPEAIEEQI